MSEELPPMQINLGSGKVKVGVFTDAHGHGVFFKDTGEEHEIGSEPDHPQPGEHTPESGEHYVHCTNIDSAFILLEQAGKVVTMFKNEHVASTPVVIPGKPYGTYEDQMLPSCRSLEQMFYWLEASMLYMTAVIKQRHQIEDDDLAQRGPDGDPLARVTPLVKFTTRAEAVKRYKNETQPD